MESVEAGGDIWNASTDGIGVFGEGERELALFDWPGLSEPPDEWRFFCWLSMFYFRVRFSKRRGSWYAKMPRSLRGSANRHPRKNPEGERNQHTGIAGELQGKLVDQWKVTR